MAEIDDEIAELRARLAKLEAQRASKKATVSAPPATPVKTTGKSNRDLVIPLIVVSAFVIILIAAVNSGTKKAAHDIGPAPPTPISPASVPAPVTPTPPPEPTFAWVYDEDVDPMSDRKTYMACVNSTDQVSLNPPYESVTARLCVRNSPKFGVDVYYLLNGDGQILCDSYDGCSVKVRYGDAPAGHNGANTAADHSSNIIFLTGARGVAARLAKAKTTKIELTFYEAGVQSVTFPTEGLDLAKVHLAGASKSKP